MLCQLKRQWILLWWCSYVDAMPPVKDKVKCVRIVKSHGQTPKEVSRSNGASWVAFPVQHYTKFSRGGMHVAVDSSDYFAANTLHDHMFLADRLPNVHCAVLKVAFCAAFISAVNTFGPFGPVSVWILQHPPHPPRCPGLKKKTSIEVNGVSLAAPLTPNTCSPIQSGVIYRANLCTRHRIQSAAQYGPNKDKTFIQWP